MLLTQPNPMFLVAIPHPTPCMVYPCGHTTGGPLTPMCCMDPCPWWPIHSPPPWWPIHIHITDGSSITPYPLQPIHGAMLVTHPNPMFLMAIPCPISCMVYPWGHTTGGPFTPMSCMDPCPWWPIHTHIIDSSSITPIFYSLSVESC